MPKKEPAITWAQITGNIPVTIMVIGLVLVVAKWGFDVEALKAERMDRRIQDERVLTRLDQVKDDQNIMKIDIAEIKQALRANDILTKKNNGTEVLASYPTPVPAPPPPAQIAQADTSGPQETTSAQVTTEEEKKGRSNSQKNQISKIQLGK